MDDKLWRDRSFRGPKKQSWECHWFFQAAVSPVLKEMPAARGGSHRVCVCNQSLWALKGHRAGFWLCFQLLKALLFLTSLSFFLHTELWSLSQWNIKLVRKSLSKFLKPRGRYKFYGHYALDCCSLAKSCLTLQPHGLQNARLPCPSLSPGVFSNSCPLSQWCHPTILSSVIPFSSCPHSFAAWGFFQWVSSLHQVAKVLELQLQHQPFQWLFRVDFI